MSDQKQQSPSKALTSRSTVQKQDPVIMITSKEQILLKYLDVFKGVGRFPSLPYHKYEHYTKTNSVQASTDPP